MGGIFEAPFKVVNSLVSAVTGLFDKPEIKMPEMATPAVEPPATLITPTAMPTPNSSEVRAAKRKSAATQLARKGRASTILSAEDGLGG